MVCRCSTAPPLESKRSHARAMQVARLPWFGGTILGYRHNTGSTVVLPFSSRFWMHQLASLPFIYTSTLCFHSADSLERRKEKRVKGGGHQNMPVCVRVVSEQKMCCIITSSVGALILSNISSQRNPQVFHPVLIISGADKRNSTKGRTHTPLHPSHNSKSSHTQPSKSYQNLTPRDFWSKILASA